MDLYTIDIFLVVFLSIFVLNINGQNSKDMKMPAGSPMNMTQAKGYMEEFGYLGEKMPLAKYRKMAETDYSSAFRSAIRMFQAKFRRFGLDVTGILDLKTMNLMAKPRCGNPDLMTKGDLMRRKKRYMLYGTRWHKNDLTYAITQFPRDRDMTERDVIYEIRRAFAVWEAVSPLRFTRLHHQSKVDIDIKFVPSIVDHGDGNPFDGAGGTLAHAFFPTSSSIGGDSHFDEAETWTLNTHSGTNLFQVAAHEFGHALGLRHSEDPSALMAPFYTGYSPNFTLPQDDRRGIQALYGSARATTTTTTTRRTTTTKPTTTTTKITAATEPIYSSGSGSIPSVHYLCSNPKFDAITQLISDGEYKTYAFHKDIYFLLNKDGVAPGYPRKIKDSWPGLPDNIDAALFWDAVYTEEWVFNTTSMSWEREKKLDLPSATFIFKGSQYWRVEDMTIVADYPREISQWGIPDNIDAAFVWKPNGRTYFIKDNQYYGYTEGVGADPDYPRDNIAWGDIPEQIDTVIQGLPGQTFFFSGEQFHVYNDTTYQVDRVVDISSYWLKCDTLTSAASVMQLPIVIMTITCLLYFVS